MKKTTSIKIYEDEMKDAVMWILPTQGRMKKWRD